MFVCICIYLCAKVGILYQPTFVCSHVCLCLHLYMYACTWHCTKASQNLWNKKKKKEEKEEKQKKGPHLFCALPIEANVYVLIPLTQLATRLPFRAVQSEIYMGRRNTRTFQFCNRVCLTCAYYVCVYVSVPHIRNLKRNVLLWDCYVK